MKLSLILAISLLVVFQNVHKTNSAKILSIAFMSSKSHKITYETVLNELVKRGHDLTVVSPIVSGKKIKNLREVQTIDFEETMDKMPNFFEMKERGEQMNPFMMVKEFEELCEKSYDIPEVQAILKEKFDLVIMPAIFNECLAGYIYKLNTTLVIVSPVSAPSWITDVLGTPSPASFVPNLFTGLDQKMNFIERTKNFLANIALYGVQTFYFKPRMEKIYRDKLNDQSIPSTDEILKNASLVISNSHLSISPIRPFMPDIVEVGGMHCKPAEPLPKEIEDFVSSGSDGFILFSMGSALKGSTMPEKYRQIFLKTFAKLKQKVLWKWETETMSDLPANVKLSKWLPQQDVLGHKNIKLFITHGGFGSTTEAVYHGVPLLGLPMFGDQDANMRKNEEIGYAKKLEFTELSEETLYNSIQEVIKNPKYAKVVKTLSTRFRDQPNDPKERAVFWIEYVLRHNGAMHLRSPARDLNMFQYHSVDVILFIFVSLFLVLYIIFKMISFIFRKICCRGNKKSSSMNKDKKRN